MKFSTDNKIGRRRGAPKQSMVLNPKAILVLVGLCATVRSFVNVLGNAAGETDDNIPAVAVALRSPAHPALMVTSKLINILCSPTKYFTSITDLSNRHSPRNTHLRLPNSSRCVLDASKRPSLPTSRSHRPQRQCSRGHTKTHPRICQGGGYRKE